jgi:pectate lyase
MKNSILLFSIFVVGITTLFAQDTLIIQETDTIGLCTFDGSILTNLANTTNGSYIDAATGVGTTVSWEILIPTDGLYELSWRYSFGGTSTNYRDGKLVIDGNVSVDTVYFPYTGTWTTWVEVAPVNVFLTAGDHKIRLEAVRSSGLANLDYFKVVGNGQTATTCTPQYTVSVSRNDSTWGTVSHSPVRNYYDKGTLITLHAQANSGYFFESWTGEMTSNDTAFTFPIKGPVHAVARFLPNGTTNDSSIIGYGGVQDDSGTTYMIFGGALGDTVEALTVAELQTWLGDTLPHVVKFSGFLTGTEQISIKSDKTFLGIGDTAHLEGIGISINQARNVIVRNISIAHVCTTGTANGDAIEINGASKNILIDHCELYSDRNNGKDYYDGLLDIKNGSTFITIARNCFHDHFKVCLISSGPTQYIDTVARLTFHHNYFYNCTSRLPSLRFGKAHIFNNYFKDSDEAIHSRIGACVRVEGNYFENVAHAVANDDADGIGYVQILENHFGSSTYVTSPTCDLQVHYPYLQFLDPTDSVPGIVANTGRINAIYTKEEIPSEFMLYQNFPNPFNPVTTFKYQLPFASYINLKVYNTLGQLVETLIDEVQQAGYKDVQWNASDVASGVYFYKLEITSLSQPIKNFTQVKKLLLLK